MPNPANNPLLRLSNFRWTISPNSRGRHVHVQGWARVHLWYIYFSCRARVGRVASLVYLLPLWCKGGQGCIFFSTYFPCGARVGMGASLIYLLPLWSKGGHGCIFGILTSLVEQGWAWVHIWYTYFPCRARVDRSASSLVLTLPVEQG